MYVHRIEFSFAGNAAPEDLSDLDKAAQAGVSISSRLRGKGLDGT